jgi:YbbR domain-containing protein
VLERLRNNLGLKLLSLAIALAGWAYLRLTPNPVIAARFQQQVSVPIATTGLASDEIARFTDRQAVVAIDVPPGGAPIRPDMVRAVLDVEGRGPGVYNVPVEVVAPKFEIKSLSPASVTLSIERVEARTLPVSVHYTNDIRRSNVVVAALQIAPEAATLRATTSDLANVAAVRVDVPLPSQPHALDAMLRPIAIDDRGNELAGIAVAPNLVRVRVKFIASTENR